MKLEQICGYLPYGLEGMVMYETPEICTLCIKSDTNNRVDIAEFMNIHGCYEVKPILYPLSDLTKPIIVEGYNEGKEFVPIEELVKIHINWSSDDSNLRLSYNYKRQFNVTAQWNHVSEKEIFFSDDLTIMTVNTHLMRYWIVQKLYQWHFDIHNLIEQKEAIDINTIEI